MPEETSGERAVKAELRHLKIDFEQEKVIHNLTGDTTKTNSRRADFYLPKYDLYIEYFGSVGHDEDNQEHIDRYDEKIRVYKENNIKCIYVYPRHLNGLGFYLKKQIKRFSNKPSGTGKSKTAGKKPEGKSEDSYDQTKKLPLLKQPVFYPVIIFILSLFFFALDGVFLGIFIPPIISLVLFPGRESHVLRLS